MWGAEAASISFVCCLLLAPASGASCPPPQAITAIHPVRAVYRSGMSNDDVFAVKPSETLNMFTYGSQAVTIILFHKAKVYTICSQL